MTIRALIIAVEEYPQLAEGLSPVLPGTRATAAAFRDWLLQVKGAAEPDIFFCCDDPAADGRTAGTDRRAVVDEILRLQEAGKDQTSELYVFLSGHGFGYTDVDGARVSDLFVCSDFRRRRASGDAVLKVDQLQAYLRLCLGPGDHYYFIDCCRNRVSTADIKASDLPLAFDASRLGTPGVYTLYSTQEGQVAGVGDGFGGSLLAGLRGGGRAKQWQGSRMAVVFQSLREFVRSRNPRQPIDGRIEGDGTGVILEIQPTPSYRCAIRVSDAEPADQFDVSVRTIRGQAVRELSFIGPTGEFEEVPDDYEVHVTHGGSALAPPSQPADLYEPCELTFAKRGVRFRSDQQLAVRDTGLVVRAPRGAQIVVSEPGPGGGHAFIGPEATRTFHDAGTFAIEVRGLDGVPFHREDVVLAPGARREVGFASLRSSRMREALLTLIPGAHGDGAVDFAPSLGPLADQGLDLWLALLGAAHIAGADNDTARLLDVPLRSFADEAPGASPVYVLAGFDTPHDPPAFGLSLDDRPRWVQARPVEAVPDLFEAFFQATAPGDLVSIHLPGGPVHTVASCRLANRVTFVTVSHGDTGELRVQQFLLPIRHLVPALPEAVRWRLRLDAPLTTTRRIVQATRQVAARRGLSAVLPEEELLEILLAKWFDPVMAVLASYDLLRRRGEPREAGWLEVVVSNLREFFPELPDSEAIATLGGLEGVVPPRRVPMVLDGYLALPPLERPRILDPDRFDYRGPWTAWINAVAPPQ